jgi:hypothetical protein
MEPLIDLALSHLASTGTAGALLVAGLHAWNVASSRRKTAATVRAMAQVQRVYETLNEALAEVGHAGRAMLLRSENGGGIPSPNRPVYSSILHEVHSPDLEAMRESWQRVKVDAQYAELLHKLATAGHHHIVTSELEDGALRTMYEAQGIVCALVYAIAADESGFNYLSVVCTADHSDTPHNKEAARAAASKLRGILEERDTWLPRSLLSGARP